MSVIVESSKQLNTAQMLKLMQQIEVALENNEQNKGIVIYKGRKWLWQKGEPTIVQEIP